MTLREQVEEVVDAALSAAVADGSLPLEEVPAAALERPRDAANGDWASTVALRAAKAAHMKPRDVAEVVVSHLPKNDFIASTEIAGPGFVNIRLTNAALASVIAEARREGMDFGRGEASASAGRINLEYVSANPTGPMHVGHGRWAALGDSMARVLRHAGFDVSEEFYINDHGTQMDNFGRSVSVRYEQLCGRDVPMPENCYGGAYVIDIAREILDADGEKWLDVPEDERVVAFRERSYVEMLEHNKAVLSGFGTTFDTWFSERTLYIPDEDGKSAVDHALEAMDSKGYVFQKDGATWFKSTAFGDEKDRVLIKENGEFTYFLSDVAYHYNKIQRGFTHLIDIWGADHHGYVKRCQAMLAAWGYEGALEVVLGQLVNLFRDGSAVRMSKRTGEMVTFEELIEEVGVDATRYLMLSRSSDQPIDFDIEVAKKKDATNPVYYVQYAHARICSILRKAACEGDLAAAEAGDITFNELAERTVGADVDLSPLCEESELALMRKMGDFALCAGSRSAVPPVLYELPCARRRRSDSPCPLGALRRLAHRTRPNTESSGG